MFIVFGSKWDWMAFKGGEGADIDVEDIWFTNNECPSLVKETCWCTLSGFSDSETLKLEKIRAKKGMPF